MCTAATYKTKDFYMGRTLDYERSYGDKITVTPRNFPLRFHCLPEMKRHHAIIGMAAVMETAHCITRASMKRAWASAG